eukprot:2892831-Karenia_brevis.AAC.1
MAPEAIVAMARLMLFKRMVLNGQHRLLAIIFAAKQRPKSWFRALRLDISVLSMFSDHFKGCVEWPLSRWIILIQESPKWFASKLIGPVLNHDQAMAARVAMTTKARALSKGGHRRNQALAPSYRVQGPLRPRMI